MRETEESEGAGTLSKAGWQRGHEMSRLKTMGWENDLAERQ